MTIFHRSGGEITAVKFIGHETYRKVANWFFVGDVKWRDGSESKDCEIAPHSFCHDGTDPAAKDRIDELMMQLNEYLQMAGTWHDNKHMRDGRVYRWTPHLPRGREAVK
jgi:hypothetical protein